jgi:hypothetical protein
MGVSNALVHKTRVSNAPFIKDGENETKWSDLKKRGDIRV